MATLPRARTTVVETAIATAAGVDTVCVWAPVPLGADITPRLFGNASDLQAQHGFSEGAEYAALHFERTQKNVLFVGLPIETPGKVIREDTSGKTGTCVTTLVLGGSGVLSAHAGILGVSRGGTVGTDQIELALSLDGGRNVRKIKLGTASSYQIPYVGLTIFLTVGGTLIAGEVIHTWFGTSPLADTADFAKAREAMAAKLQFCRSIVLVGDVLNRTAASAFLTQLNAYKTANDRAVYGRASTKDRLPQAEYAHKIVSMTGNPTLTFLEVGDTGDTLTRSAGSWLDDGFAAGDTIAITGTVSNNVTGLIATVTDDVITLGSTDLVNETVGNVTVTCRTTLTFAEVDATGDTITRSSGSWLADGFRVGDVATIEGSASNNKDVTIAALTHTTLTADDEDLTPEVVVDTAVTIDAGQTKAEWIAANEAEYETIAGATAWRIDLSVGAQWEVSPITGWSKRIPISWVASLREYQHDLHIATWRKSDGPTGGDLYDVDGEPVEYDDRVGGGAAVAARFTCARTWANGPAGSFVALSLTRADDSSLLSRTHNVAVVCLVENVVQAATENAAIGRFMILNADGTATAADLSAVQQEVNAALELAVLNPGSEGPRASLAVFTPSKTDVYNVPEPVMHGVVTLQLNGTIHSVETTIRILSGGQQ